MSVNPFIPGPTSNTIRSADGRVNFKMVEFRWTIL
jgi:hypothetical protein